MNDKTTHYIIVAILTAIIVFLLFFKPDTRKETTLDRVGKATEINVVKVHDTIRKYDTIELKADTKYVTIHDTLWRTSAVKIDSMFDSTFPRDTGDTSKFTNGYTQLRKALDANEARKRDSTKLTAKKEVVKTCTTAVSDIAKAVDTAKQDEKKNRPIISDNTKNTVIIALIAVVIALFASR